MTWRSKLGREYDKSYMDKNEKAFKTDLDRMRKQPENRVCADCSSEGTVWASINLGVFLCLRCGSIHRGLGTHVSIPKGCTGTYLWGPDELDSMRNIGNSKARELYGGDAERPSKDAGDDAWRKYIKDKYEHKKFVSMSNQVSIETKSTQSVTNASKKKEVTKTICPPQSHSQETKPDNTVVDDLLIFDDCDSGADSAASNKEQKVPDFFSEFGL
mmetsp:Transcript_2601/g.4734  ORF Transcript_2601/g.4734 Transcript_2601/m.4734 type:complete len:215 (+) Transcript_2601:84-728(+)|eukprot:CAMPEP_0114418976 /NCGR_PEP_ID=MMETSP0103-20121206/3783_1 /TAXON_ID=37642 ORGANISM="Paraphysomonas imperforata, Strain PA2" /NCGR_SAMPLE_ID=MMETSP0103 /ASSEMBLY_ACC=CAM_ASM_000201 /LENGTH=214 /DNA_ID=CAMNT_0001587369 /DNA_START=92 /DNA_END=736 /DNA_ORIENTATION=-